MQRNSTYNAVLAGPAFILLGSLIFANPAHAGFKWIEPTPQVQAPSVEVSLPEAQVITGHEAASVIAGDVQVIMAPESLALERPNALKAPSVSVSSGDVQGFANNVPLSVALRQILPRDIGFSVAQDVSLGTLVSWTGGAPWRDVLRSMLAPQKLTIKEDGTLVHVVHQPNAVKPISSSASIMKSAPIVPKISMQSRTQPVALAPQAKTLPVYVPVKAQAPRAAMRPMYAAPKSTMKTIGYLPVATAAVPAQNHTNQAWVAHKGQMLRSVLMEWGRRANVDVSWQAEYDYPFQASVSVMGTFEDAARKLLSGFQEADPKPVGYLYNNQTAGQRVLVVQTRGNNYAD